MIKQEFYENKIILFFQTEKGRSKHFDSDNYRGLSDKLPVNLYEQWILYPKLTGHFLDTGFSTGTFILVRRTLALNYRGFQIP